MTMKTWPVALIGFGGLLLLIVAAIFQSSRTAAQIHAQANQRNAAHHQIDTKLRRLRSTVYLSSIYARDYLLDMAREHADEYRQTLTAHKEESRTIVAELRELATDHRQLQLMQSRLEEYWRSLDPLLRWTAEEKLARSGAFVRREVVPRREAVLAIADEIEGWNESILAAERTGTDQRYAAFRASQERLLWQSTAIGLVLTLIVVSRLRTLEQRSDSQRQVAQAAEQQLRKLSQRLVAMREDEQKKLSRELHDHIAQLLTALRLELTRIDLMASDPEIRTRLREALSVVESMFRSVRDLVRGLRPSMLDDHGLKPALEWLTRDFISRSGVKLQLRMTGTLDGLSELQRTCVFRVVQEALTNCARHADAEAVTITLERTASSLTCSIEDNGRGIDSAAPRGLGLRGMEERVRELDGAMSVASAHTGTRVTIRVPLTPGATEVPSATIAS